MVSSATHPGSLKRFAANDAGGATVVAMTAECGRGRGWGGRGRAGTDSEAREGGRGSAGFSFAKILGSLGRTYCEQRDDMCEEELQKLHLRTFTLQPSSGQSGEVQTKQRRGRLHW